MGGWTRAARGIIDRASRASVVDATVRTVDRLAPRPTSVLPVLMYHRVDCVRERPDVDPILLSATPDAFEAQMAVVASEYTPLSVEMLLDVKRGRPLPDRAVMVTFDDGYRDFAEQAWPIMRRHDVPVTLFVPTAHVDAPDEGFWWDRLYRAFTRTERTDELATSIGRFTLATTADRYAACRALVEQLKTVPHDEAMQMVDDAIAALGPVAAPRTIIGWDDVRRLHDDGVTIAPHSRTHPMLDQIPPAQLADEVDGSQRDIEAALGWCPPVFCYPAGRTSARVECALRDASVEAAFTTERGLNNVRDVEWLSLRRVNVSPRVNRAVLRALLHPWTGRLLARA
jgi:peptidoglycan/xylan/chitin deacetylase (PgdA/CDA1 family)